MYPIAECNRTVLKVRDESRDPAAGLIQGTRTGRADALTFETAMPAFQFAVGLGIEGTGPDMGDPHEPDELLEVAGDELGTIVRDDSRLDARVLFQGFLQDDLDFLFFHGFPQLPVDDRPAVAIENAGEVVESSLDVDVGDIDVPVLMGLERLHESGAFFRGSNPLAIESTGGLEDAVNTGRTDRHDVLIEHHEGQPTVSFQGVPVVKLKNGCQRAPKHHK